MDPTHGAALQLHNRLWSLPPDVACLSACFRHCARHVAWMVCTFAVVEFYSSVRLPHILWTLLASCVQWTACAHTYSSHFSRASCETAPLSDATQSRSWYPNTHVSHIRNVRAMGRSEYAMPLIHHMRPLNHQEIRRFCTCSGPPLGGPAALSRFLKKVVGGSTCSQVD